MSIRKEAVTGTPRVWKRRGRAREFLLDWELRLRGRLTGRPRDFGSRYLGSSPSPGARIDAAVPFPASHARRLHTGCRIGGIAPCYCSAVTHAAKLSFQLRCFGFGGAENGDAGIGGFPEGEEILVGGAGLDRVAGENVRAGKAEMGERACGAIP